MNVVLHPVESCALVEQAEIALREVGDVGRDGEAEDVGAVVDRDEDNVLQSGKVRAVVDGLPRIAEVEAAAVYPEQNWV